MSKTRDCNECGKPYEYKLETSKYCSGTCRANAATKRKGLGETENPISTPKNVDIKAPKRTEINMPDGIGPQAQFIINQATKEADRWEKYSDELKADLKEKTKEAETLRRELDTIKIEQASGPSGLQGVFESDGFSKLMEHAGPGIGKLSEKFADWLSSIGSGTKQISGPDTNNPGLNEFIQWLASLDENTRMQVWQLMQYLSSLNPNDLNMTLNQLQSMGMMGPMWRTGS